MGAARTMIRIAAFAKINLTLEVLGARPDGLHEVRTILHTIDLRDRLECVGRRGPLRLHCRAPRVPADRTNLVWRAADALWRAAGRSGEPRDATITLIKGIPVQAGLGGGSSDAAAALAALMRIWNIALSRDALTEVAAGLGADVPFFLWGGAALGVGRGEAIYPLPDLPPWWVLVVVPPFGVSTADAYGWHDADVAPARRRPAIGPPLGRTWLARMPASGNDLEGAVARRHPEIGRTVEALSRSGAMLAAMSGSGSAVFGLYSSRTAAIAARRAVPAGPGWAVHLTRLLPRAAFERRARPRVRSRGRRLPSNPPLV